MGQTTIFRWFVVLSLVLGVAGALLDLFVPGLVPPSIQGAYDAFVEADEGSMIGSIALAVLMLLIVMVGLVGLVALLLLKPWGRSISLWTTVLAPVAYPALGPVVYSGWSSMLTEISMVLWGAALAMCYFSELRVHFERSDR